ncbi:MAG: tetratricopeptide repeat protein [Desulfobaccales bacterium]
MMRHTRKCLFILMLTALSLALTIPVFAQSSGGPPGPGTQTAPAGTVRGGALMPDDVYTPISKGYDLIRDGNYAAARDQFATAVKLDKFNPFALNNLAVLDEKDGKLNDALAHLKDATIHAAEYKDKVAQTCFVGGGCMAVKPVKAVGEVSTILPIINENIQKLEAKKAATGTPSPAGSPPPIMPAPKTK